MARVEPKKTSRLPAVISFLRNLNIYRTPCRCAEVCACARMAFAADRSVCPPLLPCCRRFLLSTTTIHEQSRSLSLSLLSFSTASTRCHTLFYSFSLTLSSIFICISISQHPTILLCCVLEQPHRRCGSMQTPHNASFCHCSFAHEMTP